MDVFKTVEYKIRLPKIVMKRVDERWPDQEYPSKNAYIEGLVLYDFMCKADHKVTAELMNKPKYIRDVLIREICEAFDSKDPKPLVWLKKRFLDLANQIPDDGEVPKNG